MKNETCTESFPCLASIFVLSGVKPACEACSPHLDKLRKIEGTVPDGRGFFTLKNITEGQRREIEARIAEKVHAARFEKAYPEAEYGDIFQEDR
jgi:hypothetical protein